MRPRVLDSSIKQMYRILFMRSINLEHDDLTTKARLRETALALFADHGITATSLRSIAAVAGVSPGLVIHHFGSKDGLRRATPSWSSGSPPR
jgi:TetR/AcrR family transcriptional regulator, regulator of cefoperazone and chloramphenicol sensitivity